jgi:hypothetical protein
LAVTSFVPVLSDTLISPVHHVPRVKLNGLGSIQLKGGLKNKKPACWFLRQAGGQKIAMS